MDTHTHSHSHTHTHTHTHTHIHTHIYTGIIAQILTLLAATYVHLETVEHSSGHCLEANEEDLYMRASVFDSDLGQKVFRVWGTRRGGETSGSALSHTLI